MGDQPIEKQMNQKLKTIKKEIEILIALDIKAYNMETYHQFRVLIKKLRTMDFWRKNVMKKSKKIETKALKSLFKKAGEIREYQLMLTFFVKKKKGNTNIIEIINTRLKELIQNFADKKQKALHEKMIRNYSVHLKDDSKTEKLMDHMIEEIDEGMAIFEKINLQKLNQKETLHAFRKKLKIFLNLIEVLGYEISDELINKMRQLSKILGDWHDCIENEKRCMNLLLEYDFNRQENFLIMDVFNKNKRAEKRYLARFREEIERLAITN
jgi:CHAD domain-containing protein